jgi:hypothetical protein
MWGEVWINFQEGFKMRLLALMLALFAVIGPATAQEWKEYTYPNYSFTIAFPAEPTIEATTFEAADGRSVEAQVYSLTRGNSVLKLTIAKLDPAMEERAVIDHAIKALSQGAEVKVNIEHRINWIYGRQLSLTRADGSYTTVALFYYKQRLYQLEGKVPGNGGATADAIRFQQSLTFTDEG